jgi:hypothetical protein
MKTMSLSIYFGITSLTYAFLLFRNFNFLNNNQQIDLYSIKVDNHYKHKLPNRQYTYKLKCPTFINLQNYYKYDLINNYTISNRIDNILSNYMQYCEIIEKYLVINISAFSCIFEFESNHHNDKYLIFDL